MLLGESLQPLKVFQYVGAKAFKDQRLFDVFWRNPSKTVGMLMFCAETLNSLWLFFVLGRTPSTTYGCSGLWDANLQAPKVVQCVGSIGISRSGPRHRYFDIGISTSVSQHRSGPRHRYLDIGSRHLHLDVDISTSVRTSTSSQGAWVPQDSCQVVCNWDDLQYSIVSFTSHLPVGGR